MNNKLIGTEKNIIFYNDEEGNTKIEVLLENEDVWLNTEAMHHFLMLIEVVFLDILITFIKSKN